ncbi:hypothetical protein BDP27DRAFT_485312 [Rhodocollybia butyracea]|uniref:Uncharacterized protein n=1 Tax=Rhodocollybia butyracea TaxID=206335 RepID=A0A9P5QAH6_9AGAR|nr:hypothetical protein BDP27DRAFT_485312 [Rhodocollybia butyracea]
MAKLSVTQITISITRYRFLESVINCPHPSPSEHRIALNGAGGNCKARYYEWTVMGCPYFILGLEHVYFSAVKPYRGEIEARCGHGFHQMLLGELWLNSDKASQNIHPADPRPALVLFQSPKCQFQTSPFVHFSSATVRRNGYHSIRQLRIFSSTTMACTVTAVYKAPRTKTHQG